MENKLPKKDKGLGFLRHWKVMTMTLLLLTFSIGQMWAADKTGSISLGYGAFGKTSQTNVSTNDPQDFDGTATLNSTDVFTLSVTVPKGGSLKSGNVYIYQKTTGSLTVTAPSGSTMSKIEAVFSSGKVNTVSTTPTNTSEIATTNTKYTWEGSSNSVTFTLAAGSSTNTEFKSMNITYASSTDVTAPTLSSSNPANGATDVAVEGTIVLTFSEAIASVDGTKFTLTGATKGAVAIDGTDATKVNIAYSGAANEATVMLATAAGAVSDASSNASAALSNISFTTVAAGGGGDPEPVCPTSGVIFSADVKVNSNQSFAAGSTTKISSDQADVTGGEIYAINEQGSNKNLIAPQSSVGYFCHTNNNTYFKIELECALAAGDRMTAKGYGGTKDGDPNNKGIWVSTATSRPSTAPAADGTSATASLINPILNYTVTSTDEYVGKKTIYVYRAAGASTYFDEFTITRPYTISFASAKGSAPSATTGFEVALTQITGVDGWVHTGWTADKVVKVSEADVAIGTAMAVDATAAVSANTTFTAVWKEEVPTYSVTYKANNGTEESDVVHATESTFAANMFTAPEGKMFSGWNTQADGNGTPYAVGDAVTVATTVFAQWVVDPTIRLIKKVGEEYVLNTTDFEFNSAKTTLQTADYTVEDVVYPKNVKLGGTATAVTGINADKYIAYHTKTNSTHVEIALYDAYSSNTTHNVYIARVKEGNGTPEIETVAIVTGTKRDYYKSYDLTGRTSLYIYVGNDNARVCQVFVTENGEPNVADAPAEGYSINLNKGRMFAASGVAKSFEGLTYVVAEDYQPTNRTALKIKTQNTHYISFEIPTGQTRQLQLTASGSYNVSKTLGDESAYVSGNQNINLTEGVWYINPNGSNVNITNIVFAAAPAQKTVTFKDGASTLDTKYVWSGETVSALSPAPTKSGYRFVKWQLSGADYDFATPVTDNIVLDAVWQEVVVVTFDPNNGEDTFTKTADKGAVLAVGDRPADPTYAGYDFQGWTRNAAAEPIVYVNLASETFSAAATLTAVWEVAQDDATLSALSYNGNAIDVNSAEDVSGVQTYTVHLQWGSSIDPDLVSVTKNAESATMSPITYNSEDKQATFQVTSGNGLVSVNYAIQFVIDAKRGTSIIKAVTANNTVTGLIGGTRNTNLSNGASKKLNTETYFGMTLAGDATFQEGDVIIINITAAADLGKFMVYADAERTQLVADQGIVYTKPTAAVPVLCPTGEMMMTLPAAANGKKSLYISREDGNTQWNVTFSSLEVVREMSPVIKSFKFGDDAATINESAKTISIEVPYATDVTALTPTVEAYGNNGATYTPSGATDFTSPVDYVVTDAYSEFSTTYAVTVTKAAASTNADLASLAVAGYSLDFDPATTSYNIVLDYGTTVLPAITYEVADQVTPATAVKAEGGVNGATTITVTPEAGAGYEKVYTINFSVSTNPKFVIYDGSTMTNIASRTGSDVSTGFSYSMASSIAIEGNDIPSSWGGKDYANVIKGFKPTDNTNNIVSFVIPENYVAKVRLVGTTNSTGTERQMFIAMNPSKNVADAISDYIITSSTYDAQGFITDYLLPNTYYLGSTDSYRLYEFSVTLYPIDYSRNVTEGRYGTICLQNGGVMIGAALFEVAYHDATLDKIFFDEILNGEMIAGRPYIFLPNEGVSALAVTYTDAANAPAGNYHGLYGSYTQQVLAQEAGNYILYNNQYRYVGASSSNVYVGANRAYFKIGVEGGIPTNAVAPLPGRRRVSMSAVRETPTGLENGELINGENGVQKVLINGELFILRGEKMYDATGRLVK